MQVHIQEQGPSGVAPTRRMLACAGGALGVGLLLGLAACGSSSAPASGSGNAGGGTSGSGGGGVVSDGSSIYLNVLPPGSNGNSAGGIGLPLQGTPSLYPKNFTDQATLYGDLSYAQRGLTTTPCAPPTDLTQHVAASTSACNYFKHAGLTPDTVVSTETLTTAYGGSVTIQRDGWGVPFVTAANRRDAMFGFGYAEAEDRLWLLDVLRNVGRGTTSKFLGPAPFIYQLDAGLSVTSGYSEDELTAIVEQTASKFGDLGPLLLSDVDADVAGINAYVASLTGKNASKIPPEYAILKQGGFPTAPFNRNDIVASAILVQSLFAVGGGSENVNELLLQQIDPSFTAGASSVPVAACKFWRDIRHANDPQATRTIDDSSFKQSPAALDESCPMNLPAGAAIWDSGSYQTFSTYDAGGISQNGPPSQDPESVKPGETQARAAQRGTPLLAAAPKNGKTESLRTMFASLRAAFAPAHSGTQPVATARDVARAAGATKIGQSADGSIHHGSGTQSAAIKRAPVIGTNPYDLLRRALKAGGFGVPHSMSNWQAVTADRTVDGHPIGIMGPQASYFDPELEWEVSIHSTGGTALDFNSRGIVIGNLPYVLIGRGVDYAWSATSGDSDLVDTRVSKMCNLDGSKPSREDANGDGFPDADGYLYDLKDGKGPQCRRFYKRVDSWTATPTLASTVGLGGPLAPKKIERHILRTHYGPVFATATVNGEPVAISTQRSTFFGELDTAVPFALASTSTVNGASSFQHLFNGVTGTFNWLYVDKKDVGYVQSGLLPVRDAAQLPDLPVWGDGRYEWASDRALSSDFFSRYGGDVSFPGRTVPVAVNGGSLNGGYYEFQNFLQYGSHPQAVNPSKGYILSWNNLPSKGWWAADNRANMGPIHRVDALDKRYQAFVATGRKFDFANVVELNADAAHVDLRGQELLPLLLQLMQKDTLSSDQQQIVTLMQSWLDDGSMQWINGSTGLGAWRRDRDLDGQYDYRAQVVLMDAWYQHLMTRVTSQLDTLDPAADAPGLSYCESNILLCRYDAPRMQGSAYEFGWFQVMFRMLQMVLDTPGHSDYQTLKCAGSGTLGDCRTAVLAALDDALTDLGGLSNIAKWDGKALSNEAGDKNATVEKYDQIQFTDFSLLADPAMPWSNRPTYQQVIEVTNGR